MMFFLPDSSSSLDLKARSFPISVMRFPEKIIYHRDHRSSWSKLDEAWKLEPYETLSKVICLYPSQKFVDRLEGIPD